MAVPGSRPTETLRSGGNPAEAGSPGSARLILPERLLTVRDVAERLGVCRATVYAMVERGELPAVRIASAVRVHPADLAAFLSPQGK